MGDRSGPVNSNSPVSLQVCGAISAATGVVTAVREEILAENGLQPLEGEKDVIGKLSGAALRVIGSKYIVSINDAPFVELAKLAGDAGLNADKLGYGDLLADGVIDPVKVTRSAVLNAARRSSIARQWSAT